jgi:hypothetical protein
VRRGRGSTTKQQKQRHRHRRRKIAETVAELKHGNLFLFCCPSFHCILTFVLVFSIMARTFQRNGTFAIQFVQYFLVKAKEARSHGVKASEGDFSWKTFEETHASIVEACSRAHPGKDDTTRTRVTRNNYNRQLIRFSEWLKTGKGSKYLVVCCLLSFFYYFHLIQCLILPSSCRLSSCFST